MIRGGSAPPMIVSAENGQRDSPVAAQRWARLLRYCSISAISSRALAVGRSKSCSAGAYLAIVNAG